MSSEYEKQRLERIKANEEFLAQLGVSDVKTEIKAKKTAAVKVERRRKRVETPEEPKVVRKSARLSGEKAENVYIVATRGGTVTVANVDENTTQTLSLTVAALDKSASRERAARFEEQVLDLGIKEENMEKYGREFFQTLLESSEIRNPGDLTLDYSARLSKLTCTKAVKAVPERGYSIACHPTLPLVWAGDRDGNLGMLKFELGSSEEEDVTQVFRPHVSTINVVECKKTSLYTFSYDGTVRKMDMNTPGSFNLVYKTEGNAKEVWLQHGMLSREEKSIYMAMSDGNIVKTGLSESAKSPHWKFAAHEKKAQTVSVTSDEIYMATASLDKTVKIWDLRKLPSSDSEVGGGYVCAFEGTHSISSCFFNPTDDRLVAVSMANKLHLFLKSSWTAPTKDQSLAPHHSVSHDNRTGRYLAVFHTAWDPKNPKAFVVGSMLQPRRVEVYSTESDKIKLAMNLSGDLLGSVQSRNAFHPTLNVVACVNASGRIHLFE